MINKDIEIHCEHCQCPIELWEHTLKTYQGDDCRLFENFFGTMADLECSKGTFNDCDIIRVCKEDFESEYNDIPDFEASIKELIQIYINERYMPSNYKKSEEARE